jgi:hypothetical protein
VAQTRRQRRSQPAPAARVPEINEPPATRLVQRPGSPAALMPTAWRDPADIKPDARRAPRMITGLRGYDPLRKMAGHPRSGIIAQHILAADMLREAVDLARMGFSGARPLIYVAAFAQPRWGLGPAAVRQMRAVRTVARVTRLYTPRQLEMIDAIVLRNRTLRQWATAVDPPLVARLEKRRLLEILNVLAEHFDGEIQNDLAMGRRLEP